MRGEDVVILSEIESTYIPLGIKRRPQNRERIPRGIIEVRWEAIWGGRCSAVRRTYMVRSNQCADDQTLS